MDSRKNIHSLGVILVLSIFLVAGCSSESNNSINAEFAKNNGITGNTLLSRYEEYVDGTLRNSFSYTLDSELGMIFAHDEQNEKAIVAEFTFDKGNGLVTNSKFINGFGETTADRTYVYLQDGKLDKIENKLPAGYETVFFKYSGSYLTERSSSNDQGNETNSLYEYVSPSSNLTSITTIYKFDGSSEVSQFGYHSDNKRNSATVDFQNDGTVDESRIYLYDTAGKLGAIEKYSYSGELYSRELFFYETVEATVVNLVNFENIYFP